MGALLLEGDALHTSLNAIVRTSLFPMEGKLHVQENSNLLMAKMTGVSQQKVSTPHLDLRWGRLRAILSPLHQHTNSAFSVQTPNTLVHTRASELDVEIDYEQATKTTIVLAHEFDVQVTNLFSGTSRRIPQGHSALVYEGIIQEIARILDIPSSGHPDQQAATMTSLENGVFVSLQGEAWIPAFEGTILLPGDAIQTTTNAHAELEFADGSLLIVAEHSAPTYCQIEQSSPYRTVVFTDKFASRDPTGHFRKRISGKRIFFSCANAQCIHNHRLCYRYGDGNPV